MSAAAMEISEINAFPAPPFHQRLSRMAMSVAIAIGIICRIAQYVANLSFWTDEASLVLNIRGKTAAELLGPLDYLQAAPPLFLLAERGLFRMLGGSEMALRLVPLLLGTAALLLFALVARRILSAPWDAVAVLIFALADRVIAHSVEVKPYIGDVFFCTLLLWIAIGRMAGMRADRRLAVLAAVATVGVWFSFPAAIVFGALSLALMPAIVKRSARGAIKFVVLNLPVVVSFGGLLLFTRATQKNAVLVDYWIKSFIDWHRPFYLPVWLLRHLVALADYPIPSAGPVVLLGAIFGGVALWKQRQRQLLAMLGGPILLALVPAALHRYPFDGGRLTVFLAPCMMLLAVIGFKDFTAQCSRRLGVASLLPVAYVVGVGCYWCGLHLAVPRNRGHLRPVAKFVADHARSGDTVYVFDMEPFRCYWQPDDPRLRDVLDRADQIPTRRFWIVWSYANKHEAQKPAPALAWANEFCREQTHDYEKGGAAVLFERIEGRLPAAIKPPYDGVDISEGRKRAVDLVSGK
ncbi:MAG TPA: hypothetical protein VFE47_09595 [Tepidisphaeraceae bacterium]|jgi:hypothetical protein|nr:hypothetical protein [Tepidisphaeraceae bacterium]